MATFFNVSIINADDRTYSSAVGFAAYSARTRMHDRVLERLGHNRPTFDFRFKHAELHRHELLLPEGAPEAWWDNPEAVWNAAEEAEIAASTGRFRKRGQLAKTALAHLDRTAGIPLDEQVDCLREFVRQNFTDLGVAVQIDIHPYGSPLDSNKDADRARIEEELARHPNTQFVYADSLPDEPAMATEHIVSLLDGRQYIYMPHAHMTISTRKVTSAGFNKNKARDLNPAFARGRVAEQEFWTERWVAHQNEFYKARGLVGLRIVKTDLLERLRTGKAWRTDAGQAEAAVIRDETAELLRDPEVLLEKVLQHNATFTPMELKYLLHRAGMVPEEAERHAAEVLRRDDVIQLHDVMTGRRRGIYTHTEVRSQERMVLQLSDVIASNRHAVSEEAILAAMASRTLNAEQVVAFRRHVDGDGMTLTQGRAGAGKSYMLAGVREAHEASGYRVIGLSPTNTVAADMKKDGFAEASTVHAAIHAIEKDKTTWNRKTLVVVDEAGMLDTEVLLKLLRHVAATGAKLVMVGDDRQLAAVGRGGMWPLLTDRHGASLMNQINRQESNWQKAASVAFSEGRVGDAVRAYDDRGHVHWNGTLVDAARALLDQYAKDSLKDPRGIRFVYASTNGTVNALNAAIHDLRVRCGEITEVDRYETERGLISMGVGDRIQFYANKKKAGIINGLMGTVIDALPDRIRVRTDSGDEVSLDPTDYKAFGHGYAGTVYRGQGKTVSQAYCLYDSKFAWSAKSAYVAMTRHKRQVDLFVPCELAPNMEHLVRQISREGRDGASLNWAAESDLERFHALAERQAPLAVDPYRSTWTMLWARFVAQAKETSGRILAPVQKAAAIIVDKAPAAVNVPLAGKRDAADPVLLAAQSMLGDSQLLDMKRGKTERDEKAYVAIIRRMPGRQLRIEYETQTAALELAESDAVREEATRKVTAIEALAIERKIDLTKPRKDGITQKQPPRQHVRERPAVR